MILTVIVALMLSCALVVGGLTGNLSAVSAAVTQGAGAAVTLALSLAGVICLWSGVLEVLRRAGAIGGLARLLGPLLRRLYPQHKGDRALMGDIASNVSANLLGLGSAATPAGIRAAGWMNRGDGVATDAMCTLVVCNTASIQLIPATVAAVRGDAGAADPFDILPAVWLASAISVAVGLCAAKGFARLWRRWEKWG
jgi:spore maturation protein A